MNLVVFKGLVKQTFIQIDTADDGNEAIKLVSSNSYDILFLDHLMPGKDGIQTLHDIKENKEGPNINTPAICLTANAVSGARENYMEAGFDDVSAELNRFVAEEDFHNYTIKIHALKSSSRIIGANAIGDLAQKLEDAGKAGNFYFIRENHEKFMADYSQLREDIGAIKKTDNKNKPLATSEILLEKYEEIFHAADDMDYDKLESIFRELDEYRIPEGEAVMIKKLKDATAAFDYDLIVELLPF